MRRSVQRSAFSVPSVFQGLLQFVEQAADFVAQADAFRNIGYKAEPRHQEDLRLQLSQASSSHADKVKELASSPSAISLGDIRRNRDGGATHLRNEPESFFGWQLPCQLIDRLGEAHRPLPNDELLKRLKLGHVVMLAARRTLNAAR